MWWLLPATDNAVHRPIKNVCFDSMPELQRVPLPSRRNTPLAIPATAEFRFRNDRDYLYFLTTPVTKQKKVQLFLW